MSVIPSGPDPFATDRGGPAQPLLSISGLIKHFPVRKGTGPKRVVRAVDGVDFDVLKGETLGIVGESGCGKSTTAKLIMGLIERDTGDMLYDGQAIGGRAMPLPPICWAAGPICARCRRCWAMPTSPRPKSTPMSRRADSSNSSMRNTRSLIFGTSALRR